MTKQETHEMLMVLCTAYPNYKPADWELAVNLWHKMLNDYAKVEVDMAVHSYIAKNTTGFAPSIGQIIDEIQTIRKKQNGTEDLTESEAWALLRKCTRGNIAFEALPDEIQKAIGGKQQTVELGITEDVNWDVVQSNFLRAYRQVLARKSDDEKMPRTIKAVIAATLPKKEKIFIKLPVAEAEEKEEKGSGISEETKKAIEALLESLER